MRAVTARVDLPDGSQLAVTNLAKLYWPAAKITKGDLLRYYAEVASADPSGGRRPSAGDEAVSRTASAAWRSTSSDRARRSRQPECGSKHCPRGSTRSPSPTRAGSSAATLITLLYMTQIAAISQDPWFSRVQSPLDADYVALDLDPGDDTPFDRVLDVARWIRDELASLRVPAVPKTSGSSGIHIYVPLPPSTSYESGMLFCQIVATVIAARHPRVATVERTVRARPRGTVYVDFLQNILGKTLATAYSARASSFAGVSTPLRWEELDDKIDPHDFTIRTAPARFREVGDLWARLRSSKPADLETVFRKYQARQTGRRGDQDRDHGKTRQTSHRAPTASGLERGRVPGGREPEEDRILVAVQQVGGIGVDLVGL